MLVRPIPEDQRIQGLTVHRPIPNRRSNALFHSLHRQTVRRCVPSRLPIRRPAGLSRFAGCHLRSRSQARSYKERRKRRQKNLKQGTRIKSAEMNRSRLQKTGLFLFLIYQLCPLLIAEIVLSGNTHAVVFLTNTGIFIRLFFRQIRDSCFAKFYGRNLSAQAVCISKSKKRKTFLNCG